MDRATTSEKRSDHDLRSGVSYERTNEVERSCGLLGCTTRVKPSTTTGVHLDTRKPRSQHSYALEVLMGNGEMPQKGGNYYNASSVAQSIWDRM